jgi:3-oxoacyl-[acyl-carrier protein] reductase
MNLKNQVVIVTGAGKGIGKAIALALASAGATVVVSARTKADVDGVAKEISSAGGTATSIKADVGIEEDVQGLVSTTLEKFQRIDILVNNAGIGHFASVANMKTEEFDAMWQTNVRGVFLCTRAVLPTMTKQNCGDIINIASLAGKNSFKEGAGYSATKWALIGFGRSLMLEVRASNIRVITLCPGSVDTSFSPRDNSHKNADTIPKASDIAEVALAALAMPRRTMVSEIDIRPTNPI